MEYRKNKYGRDLSVPGFGCMRFTKKGTSIDLNKAESEIMAAPLTLENWNQCCAGLCSEKRQKLRG